MEKSWLGLRTGVCVLGNVACVFHGCLAEQAR